MSQQEIPLDKIRIDGETQSRAYINQGVAALYAEEPEKLPPGKAVKDKGGNIWLWEGHHRYHALKQAEVKTMALEITEGTVEDARWLAAGSNKEHAISGLRRSNADKRKAVEMALRCKPDLSNVAIAEHVGVSEFLVRSAADQLRLNRSQKSVGKDGKTRNTSKIGSKTPSGPKPKPPATLPFSREPGDESEPTGAAPAATPSVPVVAAELPAMTPVFFPPGLTLAEKVALIESHPLWPELSDVMYAQIEEMAIPILAYAKTV